MLCNYICLEFVYSKHELPFAEVLDCLFWGWGVFRIITEVQVSSRALDLKLHTWMGVESVL